jgi:hypothetical protein
MAYPELEQFAYGFSRAELKAGSRIYIAISNVSFDQPTTEEAVMGTKPWPIARTEGEMGLGTGTVTFSSESDRAAFIADLGDGFRGKVWQLNWTLTSNAGAPPVRFACFGCKVLSNPVGHAQGAAALGGDITFSFMNHTFNGQNPHV